MLRFSKEGSDPEELKGIREPHAVFLTAYEGAENALRAGADEHHILEKIRDANAAARMIADNVKRDEAFDMVTVLETKWHTPGTEEKDATPGGTADLRERFDEFLERKE